VKESYTPPHLSIWPAFLLEDWVELFCPEAAGASLFGTFAFIGVDWTISPFLFTIGANLTIFLVTLVVLDAFKFNSSAIVGLDYDRD